MEFGKTLNLERSLRTSRSIKESHQKVIFTYNPSEIDQNQLLLVRFPNLGSDDVIIPGTANLSFDIVLNSKVDTKRTLVNDIRRAIAKRLAVKFKGNEILSIDDFDIFAYYEDLWERKSEKRNLIRQDIIIEGGCTENCMKLRINASDKDTGESSVANVVKNEFTIPLDFEMLDSTIPYYQAGLGNRSCYKATFNDYENVIRSTSAKPSGSPAPAPDATYRILNVSLEYDIATQCTLKRSIATEY